MTLYLTPGASPADVLKVTLAITTSSQTGKADKLPFQVSPLTGKRILSFYKPSYLINPFFSFFSVSLLQPAETPFSLKKALFFEIKEGKKLIFEPNTIARY